VKNKQLSNTSALLLLVVRNFPSPDCLSLRPAGCALFMREAVKTMEHNTFEGALKYHFATCKRIALAGITGRVYSGKNR